MRALLPIAAVLILAGSVPSGPARAQSCADDYVTIETIRGTIIDIKPAPAPFKTADIYLSGPSPCERVWMQVLKVDAEKCRIGDSIEVTGVVTADATSDSWQIGSAKNEYMALGDDFTCK